MDQPCTRSPDFVNDLDRAVARFRTAAAFFEQCCLDHPDPGLIDVYQRLLVQYASDLVRLTVLQQIPPWPSPEWARWFGRAIGGDELPPAATLMTDAP